MKSTIKFLAVGIFFLTFSFTTNAQGSGGRNIAPEDSADKQITEMIEKLNLDETQVSKIRELNLVYAKRMQDAQEEYKGDRKAMKEVSDAISSEKSAEMKTVLTSEQYEAFEKMQTERNSQKGREGGGRRGDR